MVKWILLAFLLFAGNASAQTVIKACAAFPAASSGAPGCYSAPPTQADMNAECARQMTAAFPAQDAGSGWASEPLILNASAPNGWRQWGGACGYWKNGTWTHWGAGVDIFEQAFCGGAGVRTGTRETFGCNPCEAKIGQTAASGSFDIGTSSSASPSWTGCYQGCTASFSGRSPTGTAIVAGVQHYYASGYYTWMAPGLTCAGGGPASGGVPANTCGAGQVSGTVNGVFRCVSADSGAVVASQSNVTTTTTTATTTADNGNGTKTDTTTSTAGDGSQTITTRTYNSTTNNTISTTTTAPADSGQAVKDQAQAQDSAEAKQAASALSFQKGPTEWTVGALGLPAQSAYVAPDVSGVGAKMPSNAGTCISLDVTLPYLGPMSLNPCPVVTVVRPLVNFMVIVLGVLAGVGVVLGAKAES